MFRVLINDAKDAAGEVVGKYAARAAVVVPFACALGFATLAITIVMIEWFGSIIAFVLLACAFAGIGVIAAVVVGSTEKVQLVADKEAVKVEAAKAATEVSDLALAQSPLVLLSGLMSAFGGPTAAIGVGRQLGRNLPLIVLVGALGYLLWQESTPAEPGVDANAQGVKPNGAHPPPGPAPLYDGAQPQA